MSEIRLSFEQKARPLEYPEPGMTSEQKARFRLLHAQYLEGRQTAMNALFSTLEKVNDKYDEAYDRLTTEIMDAPEAESVEG